MTLREARFFKGLNQYDIALRTSISQSRISLIERGYLKPKDGEKEKIAKALDCQAADIFPQDWEPQNE